MEFDVSTFKTNVLDKTTGFLRPEHFRVRIFPPPGLALPAGVGDIIQNLELWGEASEVPLMQMGSHQMYRFGYGAREQRPYAPVYEGAWPVSFRLDGEGNIWKFFHAWNNLIINTSSASQSATGAVLYELAYKDSYLADTEVTVFSPHGDTQGNTQTAINVTMIDAFPYSLGAIKLDWHDGKEVARCTVAFAFTDWIASDGTQ